MKKAWVKDNVIIDVCEGNPDLMYMPIVAANYFAEVPDNIVKGASMVDGVWVNPVVDVAPHIEPETQLIPLISPVEFKLLFTPQERIAIKAALSTDVIIDDLFTILDDPRLTVVNLNLDSNKDAVSYLQSKGLITAERKAEIMTGILK